MLKTELEKFKIYKFFKTLAKILITSFNLRRKFKRTKRQIFFLKFIVVQ